MFRMIYLYLRHQNCESGKKKKKKMENVAEERGKRRENHFNEPLKANILKYSTLKLFELLKNG